MPSRSSWSRGLVIGGLAGMVTGLVDPIEGCVVILAGNAAAAAGGRLGGYRARRRLLLAALLSAVGVSIMFGMAAIGGIAGNTGRSGWWALLLLPYPAGWLLGVIGAVQALREARRPRPPVPE